MTAATVCRTCGVEAAQGSRFCGACGTRLAAVTEAAEYKQVTVLFADVVRSMDIAAALDMERLREVMAGVAQRAAAVVRRYGGTVQLTGDGLMAIFGAPKALEDHAFRACVAALAIQDEMSRLAAEVRARDGVLLQVRVGLNSGRVIAGEIGSGSLGYTATGRHVGFAQRMESVAPPGGVMLSESTALLVQDTVVLGEAEWVRIKGAQAPVPARRLLGIGARGGSVGRAEASLVGRATEMAALDAVVDRTLGGRGAVVAVVGPAGIGKSRAAREVATLARGRGVEVVWTFCESHAADVPFYAVSRLLRAGGGVADLDGPAARAQLRSSVPAGTDPQDLLLLGDLLGVADPEVELPRIDPDARRRRLTALVNAVTLARTEPTLFIVEDAHWIDAVSESMIADLLGAIPGTPSMVLVTYRPEYQGLLTRTPQAQTITLAPLADADTAVLVGELLGSDPSVSQLAAVITERAAGNPFFVEELVRDLAQRGVLTGARGGYRCDSDAGEVNVPATVQAAIAARIDRLGFPARRTLHAASVIGARFDARLLAAVGIEPALGELVDAELIEQVRFTPAAEYAFRHPLIRAVAYESQLKSDRAELHRRLAAVIESQDPDAAEENAASIAEHWEAAGDAHPAFGWHMRAAAWSTNRDINAARLSWQRAQQIADRLPDDDPARPAMRIAPRTMLCATDYNSPTVQESRERFTQFRELCEAAGDKVSLAIGMTGLAAALMYGCQSPQGAALASEQMHLLESNGSPDMVVGVSFAAFNVWADAGEFDEVLRWSEAVIALADGDPAKGAEFGAGSPLANALAWRGNARWLLGHPGWRRDIDDAVALARSRDPATFAVVFAFVYNIALDHGVLRADDATVQLCEEAVQAAGSSSDVAVFLADFTLAIALLARDAPIDRDRGLGLMVQFRERMRGRAPHLRSVAELWIARDGARHGDADAAIAVMRAAVDEMHHDGRLLFGMWGFRVLVEALVERGGDDDLTEAEEAIDRLARFRADHESAVRAITLLRLRTLVARARGDSDSFRALRDRYRAMAGSLGYEGHMDWAAAMSDDTF